MSYFIVFSISCLTADRCEHFPIRSFRNPEGLLSFRGISPGETSISSTPTRSLKDVQT